jgi:hypothetical protein
MSVVVWDGVLCCYMGSYVYSYMVNDRPLVWWGLCLVVWVAVSVAVRWGYCLFLLLIGIQGILSACTAYRCPGGTLCLYFIQGSRGYCLLVVYTPTLLLRTFHSKRCPLFIFHNKDKSFLVSAARIRIGELSKVQLLRVISGGFI